ncbi:MAG TPA: TIGR03826 family flagellar region protein [Cerasibacillus sp.]|uniref:TIGR03826 family flagellar region protein n=1 Tax=Cerasibacillus sp. TaxID=2498711 RepID=UPI002F3E664E
MPELANCSRCGAVYVKDIRDICHACFKEEEKSFRIVYDFLKQRKNREATLIEIVEATGVEEELIIKFIKEKRLRQSQFPKLTYPCERCGKQIISGNLCEACGKELKRDLKVHEHEETMHAKLRDRLKEKERTYFTLDKHKEK